VKGFSALLNVLINKSVVKYKVRGRPFSKVTGYFMIRGIFTTFREKQFFRLVSYMACRRGATTIEYGLIVAGIAVGVSVSVVLFGSALKGYFEYFANYLSNPGG